LFLALRHNSARDIFKKKLLLAQKMRRSYGRSWGEETTDGACLNPVLTSLCPTQLDCRIIWADREGGWARFPSAGIMEMAEPSPAIREGSGKSIHQPFSTRSRK